MSADEPLLTIAIPTYNRSNHLAQLLASLTPQLETESRVELLISDNASQDDTPAVVESFQKKGLRCRYLRNASNIGADANFLQCFEEAKGTYVWIFGDDDVLQPSGLRIALTLLDSDVYDLVHISYSSFLGDAIPPVGQFSGRYTVYRRPEDLARRVHVSFTFISANIVNKRRISGLEHRPFADLLNTNFIQLAWVYTALDHHRQSAVIHDPIVAGRGDNSGGYELFRIFGPNLKAITDEWLSCEKVKWPITNAALQRFLPAYIIRAREAPGSYVREDPHRVLRPVFGRQMRYWILAYPLIFLPSKLAKLWLLMVRVVNKIDLMAGNQMLRL